MRKKRLDAVMGWYYHREGIETAREQFRTFDCGVTVPDVVRNLRGVDGWRKPSPYSCDGTSGSVLYAECLALGWSFPHWTAHYRGNMRGWTGDVHGPSQVGVNLPGKPQSIDIPRALRARAINEAIRQLQNRQGHILETVAEFRQSIQGLARNAQSITDFCDAFEASVRSRSSAPMRRHFRLPKKHKALKEWKRKLNGTLVAAKTFGSAWLTFWFGLAPVVSDMVLFMRILGDSNLYTQNLSGKGRGFHRTTRSGSVNVLTDHYSGFDGGFRAKYSVREELGIYVSLTCNPNKDWVMQRAREAAQLGSLDGLSTIWAITPYSWLIDFVLPVSQYLKGWEGRHGLDFRGGTTTIYRSYSDPKVAFEKIGVKCSIEPFGEPVLYGPRTFVRDVLKNLPAPVFMPRLPADYWKATTALSLLAVKFNHYFGETPRRA